jgi:hypothetical protein
VIAPQRLEDCVEVAAGRGMLEQNAAAATIIPQPRSVLVVPASDELIGSTQEDSHGRLQGRVLRWQPGNQIHQ